jgi:hypothetical protein
MYVWEVVARYRADDVAEAETSSARAGNFVRFALTGITFMAVRISIISLSCEKSCTTVRQLVTRCAP